MNTFQAECFLAVAEHLNFARAAELLNVTQPAVTHQIRSLEQELNTRLFHRTTRSVSLTPAGILFLDDARQFLAVALRARNRFRTPEGQAVLPFSIGCHSHVQLQILPPVLRQMKEEFPNLHPQFRIVPFRHLYRLLEEEQVDAIISFQEPDFHKIPGIFLELGRLPVTCLCPSDSPLTGKQSLTMEELADQPLVLVDPLHSPGPLAQLQARLLEGKSPADVYFCESPGAAMVLVRSGIGICVLPAPLAMEEEPGLSHVPVEGLAPVCYGVYYKSLDGNEPLKRFVQLLKELFKDSNI